MEGVFKESSLESCVRALELLYALGRRGQDMSNFHFFPYEGGVMFEWHKKGIFCEVVGESDEFEVQKAERPDERGLVKIETSNYKSVDEAADKILNYLK